MAKIRRIFIVTHPTGFFGRADYGWKSLEVSEIADGLRDLAPVEIRSIHQISEEDFGAEDVVLYSSSEDAVLRQYYKDALYFVSSKAILVPSYPYLLAHENKGFQEILKLELGISGLNGSYHFDLSLLEDGPFPFVLKSTEGAGSSGVWLVRSPWGFKRLKRRLEKYTVRRLLLLAYRKMTLSASDYAMYSYRHRPFQLVACQEFIPNLEGDFKVLIFGQHYFVLKRRVRKNDFRASGSGIFSFEREPDTSVLDYAEGLFGKFNAPYISLDVAKTPSGECRLIEFQALHFGPYTLLKSPGFFERRAGIWRFQAQSSRLEPEIAQAVKYFVRARLNA